MKKKVFWFLISFSFVSLIPHEKLRRWANDKASLVGFRILTRSLSAVITIYNEEYKPKRCGFCVANHTSPIDVAILSSDCTYSLVSNHLSLACPICNLSLSFVKKCSQYI